MSSMPMPSRIRPAPLVGRMRLAGRFLRFAVRSARLGWHDSLADAIRAEVMLVRAWIKDVVRPHAVTCPICGWQGAGFYPNVGPGFAESATACPGCGCQDRHRALAHVLAHRTGWLEPHVRAVEVAPMRGFQRWCLAQPGLDYVSFDIERHAMQRGDITAMRFASGSVDVFICFHVLEHVPDEGAALREIHRVLRPGGLLVAQVPLDSELEHTVEYGGPVPKETNHVRRYGRDFAPRLAAYGFEVEAVSASDLLSPERILAEGINTEDVYLARRLDRPGPTP